MAPCKFYLQGYCKFGDKCKFDHPGAQRGNQQNQNRFAALGNANTGGAAPRGPRGGPGQDFKYNLDPDIVRVDLTSDRPIWPFSVYAPGRLAPRQLIEGPTMEQSPEEMRLRFYAAMRSGSVQQAQSDETQLANQVQQQIQNILGDLNGACRYVQDGENVHPNRHDICKQSAGGAPQQPQQQQQTGAFGQGNAAFGQPSAFGATAKPQQGAAFGQPSAFGAAAGQQQQSAFGRPSAFGAAANQQSAFGSPSPLGANPAFGKPAFGAPSAFGQAANAGSTTGANPAFGQPSQPSGFGQSAFGAKPAFGQPAGGGGFGQAAQGGGGAFGKPAGAPAFGQPAFGQPAQPAGGSPFGQLGQQQSGGFGQAANQQPATGGFGQPSNQQPTAGGGFGQPSNQQSAAGGGFGQSSNQQSAPGAFGQPAVKPSPFGAPAQQATPSAFGAPASSAPANPFSSARAAAQPTTTTGAPQANGFGQRAPVSNATASVGAGVDVSSYSTRGGNNQVTSWKGQPVQYLNGRPCYRRPDNGQWERIWLPDGPPPENAYSHAPPEAYGEVLREAYEFLNKTGTFKDGIMPEEPPKHEWIGWDV